MNWFIEVNHANEPIHFSESSKSTDSFKWNIQIKISSFCELFLPASIIDVFSLLLPWRSADWFWWLLILLSLQMVFTLCQLSVCCRSPSSPTRCSPTASHCDWPTRPRSASSRSYWLSSWRAWPAFSRRPVRMWWSSTSRTTRTSTPVSWTSACPWPCRARGRGVTGSVQPGWVAAAEARWSSSDRRSCRSVCIWTAVCWRRSPRRRCSRSTTTSACGSRARTTWSACPCWSSTAWHRSWHPTPSCSAPSIRLRGCGAAVR